MIPEHELAQTIFRHTTDGYDLTPTGLLSFRVRAENAAHAIAVMLQDEQERQETRRSRTVIARPTTVEHRV